MNIFRFDRETGRNIDHYNSSGSIISRVAHLLDEAVVHCATLEPKGVIGYHRATLSQLFLIVQGEGWVRGEAKEKIQLTAGRAAYWEAGEWHETSTDTGLIAMIIECNAFDLSGMVPLK